ncbi:MAG: hypothetical protein L0H73_00480 [Nitrococcus sp.]|nr:hypothetical protein [Nitrococcus sp.]
MAAFSNGAALRRRWFFTLSLVAAIGVVTLGALLWQAVGLSSLSIVSERVAEVKPCLGILRFALISLLAIAWPRLPVLWTAAADDDGQATARWMALRWRVVGWLLVIELVLGQNLIGRFLDAMVGALA